MTYDELVDLPEEIANAFILSPMYIGGDSIDLETYIETVWKALVTLDNYKAVAQSFRQWYRETSPDEYHDPPTAEEMQAAGHDVAPHRWTHGGSRPGNPNGKRGGAHNKPRNPAGVRIAVSITLDPDVHRRAVAYATANGMPFSQAVNVLLTGTIKETAA